MQAGQAVKLFANAAGAITLEDSEGRPVTLTNLDQLAILSLNGLVTTGPLTILGGAGNTLFVSGAGTFTHTVPTEAPLYSPVGVIPTVSITGSATLTGTGVISRRNVGTARSPWKESLA